MKTTKPKLTPVNVNSEPMQKLQFMPPVTLSCESALEMKPTPLNVSMQNTGEGTVRRRRKVARTAGARKAGARPKARSRKAKGSRRPA